VRYAIAILVVLACAFYVFVLIQLRRDEKSHSSHSSPLPGSSSGRSELESFTAVRAPGHSFANWSRLTARRSMPEAGGAPSRLRKREESGSKIRRLSYVELALPLSSGVTPVEEDAGRHHVVPIAKKSAWRAFTGMT
jgi:hypothetical protein